MGKLAVLALRAVIVTLLGGSVFVQGLMVWLLAGHPKGLAAQEAHQRAAFAAITLAGFVAVEVVLLCVGRLVTMARRGTVFSPAAFRYVHVVIGAMVAAAVLMFALAVVLAPGEAVPPGVVLMLGAGVVAITGVALIVLALRTLLAQAVARDAEAARMRAELAEVI
jgi:hypothetical protein